MHVTNLLTEVPPIFCAATYLHSQDKLSDTSCLCDMQSELRCWHELSTYWFQEDTSQKASCKIIAVDESAFAENETCLVPDCD